MAQKPEEKLLSSIQNNDLSMTGKPVLVQNQLGIFYGTLEKADTRNGTVLLSDGYMISPERHITYARYLDFLDETIEDALFDALQFESPDDPEIDEDDPANDVVTQLKQNYKALEDVFADGKNYFEIIISSDTFSEHHTEASITDYASEGIALVNRRTAFYANTSHVQEVSPLISLTNTMAIVPISNTTYGDRFKSIIAERDDVAGKLFDHFKLDKFYKLSALSTFIAIGDSDEYSPRIPRLVVNTPQREERFKKRDDNIVVLERHPHSRFFGKDEKGNSVDVTNEVLESVLDNNDAEADKA